MKGKELVVGDVFQFDGLNCHAGVDNVVVRINTETFIYRRYPHGKLEGICPIESQFDFILVKQGAEPYKDVAIEKAVLDFVESIANVCGLTKRDVIFRGGEFLFASNKDLTIVINPIRDSVHIECRKREPLLKGRNYIKRGIAVTFQMIEMTEPEILRSIIVTEIDKLFQ